MIQKIKSPKLIIIWFTDFHALNPSTSFKKSWMGLMNRFIRHWSEFNILEFSWQWITYGNFLNDFFFFSACLWMYQINYSIWIGWSQMTFLRFGTWPIFIQRIILMGLIPRIRRTKWMINKWKTLNSTKVSTLSD